MLRICVFIPLVFLAPILALAGHSPPKIFFAVYVQTTGQGLPPSEARPIQVPPDGQTILIRALPEITEHDLIDVQEDSSGSVHFRFDHQGQVDLSAVTAENQGRILVVTLNGFVYFAPLIDEQITDGELVVPHHLDPRIIQLLQGVAQANVKAMKRQ